MRVASAFVPRPPAACWRAFTDPTLWKNWVPGLRRARVVTRGPDGLPGEVQFELAASLSYTLVYAYDPGAGEVRWEPGLGRRDAVRGYARFVAEDAGARMTYGIEGGPARAGAAPALDDPRAVVAAFVRWMAAEPR